MGAHKVAWVQLGKFSQIELKKKLTMQHIQDISTYSYTFKIDITP